MEKLSLGREFPQPGHEDWLGLVEKTLKGADFDKRLVSHTYEGLRIEPLYFDGGPDAAEPGQAPFRRGVSANPMSPALCQSFAHPNLRQTNTEILEDIANGVSAIRLKIDDGHNGGIVLKTPADLERVLEGVYLDMIPVEIDAGTRTSEIAGYMALFGPPVVWQEKPKALFSMTRSITALTILKTLFDWRWKRLRSCRALAPFVRICERFIWRVRLMPKSSLLLRQRDLDFCAVWKNKALR